MTRINLVPPQLLTDQHLLAENKEINQLAGQMLKSLRSPNFKYGELPMHYTLGKGHVRFWLDMAPLFATDMTLCMLSVKKDISK